MAGSCPNGSITRAVTRETRSVTPRSKRNSTTWPMVSWVGSAPNLCCACCGGLRKHRNGALCFRRLKCQDKDGAYQIPNVELQMPNGIIENLKLRSQLQNAGSEPRDRFG